MSNCNTGAAAAILSSRASAETTPLIQSAASTAAYSENGHSYNWKHDCRSRCSFSLHILNILGLAIVLFGGLVVSVWLYIDRAGNTDTCNERCMLHLITREEWGADTPTKNAPDGARPAALVVIAHTATSPCNSTATCMSEVKAMQLKTIRRNFSDIKYSFLVGGDGLTYEGRGWDAVGALASNFDDTALGIAFIGNFDVLIPSDEQLNQAEALIQEALYQNKLSPNYKLVAHQQVAHTDSPGTMLYSVIRTWPHWENCFMQFC